MLEGELIVNHPEQFDGGVIGHVLTADFDSRRFADKIGMGFGQFAVEQERNVGVELFLQLMQSLLRAVPWPRLIHDEHDFVRLRVVREDVDDTNVIARFGV